MKLTASNIEETSICGNLIKIIVVRGKHIAIDKPSFEHWVDARSGREWGDIQGNTGSGSWDEYYHSDYFLIDLVEYYNEVREIASHMKQFDRVIEMIKA